VVRTQNDVRCCEDPTVTATLCQVNFWTGISLDMRMDQVQSSGQV
jgi:hypothetical protein